MKFFDTHSHYNDEAFDDDINIVINDIYKEGITKTVVVGYDIEKSKRSVDIANKYNFIYSAVGIHPSNIEKKEKEILKQIETIKEMTINPKVVAIGEIGLDYHWEKENKELQKFAFLKQIELANELKLPIIIHTRDAIMDTIEILKSEKIKYSGVLHCCSLNKELIDTGLKAGLYISFAGPITFKNSKNAKDVVNMVPLNKILIETDSPYLAPEPKRGTRNDSRNVKLVAQKIAEFKNISLEEVAKATYENALRIFKI